MASVNKVILIGNLGADPELKMTPSGKALCNLRIATTSKYKDKETTEWHRVVCWDKTAENCGKFLQKGRSVFVEGRLQTRSYEKDGQKHYATDIVADNVVFLGGKGEQAESHPAEEKARKAFPGAKSVPPEDDSNVPF